MVLTVGLVLSLSCGFVTATINYITPSLGLNQSLEQSWAEYSPYYPASEYTAPPDGCSVVQLQRDGAHYPKKSDGKSIMNSVEQLQGAKSFNGSEYEFLTNFTYSLGTDDLVSYGAAQSYDAGQLHYTRYASLLSETMMPFVRASDSERVVDSALNWTAGFAFASNNQYAPVLSVIIDQSTNDTLDDNMCPNVGTSDDETEDWADVFAPAIADRINAAAPGAKLSNSDVVNIMTLCPLETVANEAPSPFCDLFTSDEFASFEYYGDLDNYYGNGYGQQLGPVQGVGYVNELLARLTGQPVQDETQTNHTLDSSPTTFPMNLTFYADFSHDSEMISIISALGLFAQPHALDTTQPNTLRTWQVSKMVPFSGRLTTEKLSCTAEGETGEYVRILVNDAVQSMYFCGDTGNGLCALDDFVESQEYARLNGEGDWALCTD
ncbi:acid phosphatase [Leucogyrophana mollusca]|uniref:Acid phosphatase n=1 Tax=Leucogyrophana mollusca TaxID=85980 RepID=A0ACB8BQT5_9AGAM|nr:acid phosphatase [Leucogyrophana mollusca]